MATQSYRKRMRAYEGEERRAEAVRRLRSEANVRAKMHSPDPRTQQYKAEQIRAKANTRRQVPSQGGAVNRPVGRFNTLAGVGNKRIPGHRLTLGQALARRTTDSSRARVAAKYGVGQLGQAVAERRSKVRKGRLRKLPTFSKGNAPRRYL